MIEFILKPLDDSMDLVLVCDHLGVVLGTLHIDCFVRNEKNAIYDQLWNGQEVRVQMEVVREYQRSG